MFAACVAGALALTGCGRSGLDVPDEDGVVSTEIEECSPNSPDVIYTLEHPTNSGTTVPHVQPYFISDGDYLFAVKTAVVPPMVLRVSKRTGEAVVLAESELLPRNDSFVDGSAYFASYGGSLLFALENSLAVLPKSGGELTPVLALKWGIGIAVDGPRIAVLRAWDELVVLDHLGAIPKYIPLPDDLVLNSSSLAPRLVLRGTSAYVMDAVRIIRISTESGLVDEIAPVTQGPAGLGVTSAGLYWLDSEVPYENVPWRVRWLPTGAAAPVDLAVPVPGEEFYTWGAPGLLVDDERVYWKQSDLFFRAPAKGGERETIESELHFVDGVAQDEHCVFLSWGNSFRRISK